MRGQLLADLRRLVRRGVVEDHVDVEIGRDLTVERLQEPFELDRAMPAVKRSDDLAGASQHGLEVAPPPFVRVRNRMRCPDLSLMPSSP